MISAWAGIRPLAAAKYSGRGSPSSASREHAIRFSPRGVLTVTGGKLTTYRAMAEECVDAVVRRLGGKRRPCDTAIAHLPGQRPPSATDDQFLVDGLRWREADVVHAVRAEFAESVADVVLRRTLLAYEMRDHGISIAPRVAQLMGALLGWTAEGMNAAVVDYERDVQRVFGINP